MIEQIFYYTGGITLILLSLVLSLFLIGLFLYCLKKLVSNIRIYLIFAYSYSKMTNNERKIIEDLYKSMIEGNKEYIDNYFLTK